jgi:hypothetical protein
MTCTCSVQGVARSCWWNRNHAIWGYAFSWSWVLPIQALHGIKLYLLSDTNWLLPTGCFTPKHAGQPASTTSMFCIHAPITSFHLHRYGRHIAGHSLPFLGSNYWLFPTFSCEEVQYDGRHLISVFSHSESRRMKHSRDLISNPQPNPCSRRKQFPTANLSCKSIV